MNAKQKYALTSNNVYSMLIRNDVASEDVKLDASQNGNFDKWVEEFEYYDGRNIYAFVDPGWKYFCQFRNRDQEVLGVEDQVKVYIPLDGEHLTSGVEQVFKFLKDNNIAHISKVGKHIRFDNIVVRLGNLEDADKLNAFINENSYIQEGLIKNNPFAVERDGIAYASDRGISYNNTVASLVNLYVDDVIQRNNLTGFGVEGFQAYILNYYNNVLLNPKNQDRLSIDFNHNIDDSETIYNYIRVVELLYESLDPNFTYEDYKEHYNKNLVDYYRPPELAIRKDNIDEYELEEPTVVDAKDEKVQALMTKALIEFGKKTTSDGKRKYSYDDVVAQIYEYLETGSARYITSSGGLRDDFVKNNFRGLLSEHLITHGMSFNDFLIESKKQILDKSLGTMCDKYGRDYDIGFAIKHLLDEGNYNGFTKTNGARSNMEAAVSAKDISKIIMKEFNYPSNLSLNSFSREQRDALISQYAANVKEQKYNNIL